METKATVLLVEDDDAVRFVLRTALAYAGFHVLEARSGNDAVDMMAANSFAAVVCDYHMPGLSGIETIRRLRDDAATEKIPALLVSGSLDVELTTLDDLGNTGFLAKPFLLTDLTQQVRAMIDAADSGELMSPGAAPH